MVRVYFILYRSLCMGILSRRMRLDLPIVETTIVETTYGSASELMAAAVLYTYSFEVYENGLLRGSFGGDSGNPKKRLRFNGSFLGGPYEVLLPEVPPNDDNSN
ncbi:unnamed protein product [Euphydryas editha]|uniref:Uncharacterized protein n=1 Tax=Euphydryas editha TaxID=104508 RepID=A0AAU9UNQ2_EUPED|nr:unnamed protein product [Euphydryas editha]